MWAPVNMSILVIWSKWSGPISNVYKLTNFCLYGQPLTWANELKAKSGIHCISKIHWFLFFNEMYSVGIVYCFIFNTYLICFYVGTWYQYFDMRIMFILLLFILSLIGLILIKYWILPYTYTGTTNYK